MTGLKGVDAVKDSQVPTKGIGDVDSGLVDEDGLGVDLLLLRPLVLVLQQRV